MTVRLHHELIGPADAPVVVMPHALGLDSRMWAPLVFTMRLRFRVLLADIRGHGSSPVPAGPYRIADLAEDFLNLLDRLGIARASWCGLSLGGLIAMWVAAHAPHRVERLALCCTAPRIAAAGGWDERAAAVRRDGITDALVDNSLERWLTDDFRRSRPDRSHYCAATLRSCETEGYAACCEALGDADLGPQLTRITAPTLVLAGIDDPVCPVSAMAEIVSAVEGSTLWTIPGRHLAVLESAERCAPVLADHLAAREMS
ncbi:MAG TPA: 3-oxoadipate enol-lactonase [Stackebrandtia sp.]|jgi:3-oxoadipate enol-lactonase|uniref:3-oxoadipate enol-lactonase n=1 Tax=Stackebrandtia sp. TaxID=2023065 RepID=UPI002D46D5C4|nr:3-oxoadipate enol-lactonase [Stackebrandtia sp.]HZE38788.1 3-oxoadipate enol-lactonase [Stackebrandtia sp.]